MSRHSVGLILASLVVVAVQLDVLTRFRIAGVVVMLIWLWCFIVGLLSDLVPSLLVAASVGVLFDMHAATPFGLDVAVCLVCAYVGVRLGREGLGDLAGSAPWLSPLLGIAVAVGATLTFLLSGTVVADLSLWSNSVGSVIFVNAVAFAVLLRVATWGLRAVTEGRR